MNRAAMTKVTANTARLSRVIPFVWRSTFSYALNYRQWAPSTNSSMSSPLNRPQDCLPFPIILLLVLYMHH